MKPIFSPSVLLPQQPLPSSKQLDDPCDAGQTASLLPGMRVASLETRRSAYGRPLPPQLGLNPYVISKRWIVCQSTVGSAQFRTIQTFPKDLSRDWRHCGRKGSRQREASGKRAAGDPRFDWPTWRWAMNMSVTQLVQNRSVWHEIMDTVIEGPRRTAADEIAEYLARHPYDLSPTLRIELERRHVCV
jgi:hypothetical protein